ncbi:MAG: HAMP domain-containing sensor histidine kinase [Gordonia sp. (in: high G+C Gram-positive bacteria)]|uniref:sensor histidine kinase n=1 Tax=Gordonia sp. (in: high G+C Gram-positive bacteria) TaxID=84139 RepID=UPI0039E25EBF
MSSSRRRSAVFTPGAWSLRTRLVVGQLLVLALVCIGIGSTTEIALRHSLVAQLDNDLQDAVDRSVQVSESGRPNAPKPGPGPVFLDAPGQPTGIVAAVVRDEGRSSTGTLASDGSREKLTAAATKQLAAIAPRRPPSTAVIDGKGDYRLAAARNSDGATVVVGLPMAGVNHTLWRMLVIMVAVTAAALAAATTVGIAVTRRALAPLTRVAATAREVADLPLHRGEVELPVRVPAADTDPATEVGQMNSALNRMLDHMGAALSTRHASETRVRQFVADASHELRTPLAAIRGYAELAHRHRTDVPDEVAYAIGRVESEAERMTRLVEDLLLLARLDSGRPLEREPVDMSQLAVDAVSDAHAAGPDHCWQLDLPGEPVVVTGDAARLHQVVVNLLANARVHTPDGTLVTVGLSPGDGETVISVADNGPGIDPALQNEVFTRFARGDSRARSGGGTGLGLSIVDAVVKAHRGSIDLRSRPGHTVFRIHLPSA